MNHPLDRPVASDLSYRVLELQRQRGELGACALDRNHQLFNVPSLIAHRRRFIADTDEWLSDASGSHRVESVTPSFNGRK